ncbi:MAG: hypothetical protein ABI182_05505 [Candidatus Baltobacteraceae bacterium]
MLAGLACGAAAADVSIAGGGLVSGSPSSLGAAAILSSAASIPAVPVELQGSLLVPLAKNGGYALTGEVRGFTGGGFGGAYVGGGLGIGRIGSMTTGPVLTLFAGKSIAPFTSIEIRFYKQTQEAGATAGFLGLRFSL